MARKSKHAPDSAAKTLDELESLGDKLGHWLYENAIPVLGTAVAILAVAGVWGFLSTRQDSAQDEASAELARLQESYREAMGATPGDFEVVEPANPETARQVREEYIESFREFAESGGETRAAALAWLSAGELQVDMHRYSDAAATFEKGADLLEPDDVVRALLLERLAGAHEAQGAWAEAGAAYEKASQVTGFPLRHGAMADSARCYAEAGDTDKALDLYSRIENEAPNSRLPEHIESRLRELRAEASIGSPAS